MLFGTLRWSTKKLNIWTWFILKKPSTKNSNIQAKKPKLILTVFTKCAIIDVFGAIFPSFSKNKEKTEWTLFWDDNIWVLCWYFFFIIPIRSFQNLDKPLAQTLINNSRFSKSHLPILNINFLAIFSLF